MSNNKANVKTNKGGVGGIKMLLVAGSLAITLGGWGKLAADQFNAAAPAQAVLVQSAAPNAQSTASQIAMSQVSSAPLPVARTRSSR